MIKLKQLREARNMTQEELAAKAGITAATISRAESGKCKPHKSILRLIAQALKVNPKELQN